MSQNEIDMNNARARTTISPEAVRDFLYEGRVDWKRRERILSVLINDPIFDKSRRIFMNRTERYNRGLRIINRIFDLQNQLGWSKEESITALTLVLGDEALPITLHTTAFKPVFKLQASPSLLKQYGQLIAHRGIIGCYLQTELAHGTNVRGLETTATYIPETKEFEIHSPRLESSKWWIGALGKLATHGVIQAKLILPDGKDYGPHLFFIQLRSLDDHKLLPGITAGDIGPKVFGGQSANDNGFARFDHVRIPKEYMLSRFAQVKDDGTYVRPLHDKVSYGGMLYIRSGMITSAGWSIAKAATIAIRYATVRRQGELDTSSDGLQLERQVITYPSVHYRLLPILSHAYVFIRLGRAIFQSFQTMADHLSAGDPTLLAEQHALASGLKVLCTTTGIADIESARRSMGGHGYSAFSGMSGLYGDYLPSATYEGENFVLDQQVARAALKAFHNFLADRSSADAPSRPISLPPSSAYLRHLLEPTGLPALLLEPVCWSDPDSSIMLLEWRAAFLVHEHAHTVNQPDANIVQRVSKAVTEAFVAARVGEMIRDFKSEQGVRQVDHDVVGKLFNLYLLTTVESALTDLSTFGLLRFVPSSFNASPLYGKGPRDPTRNLRLAISQLCQDLLPNATGLTDAFGFSDWELDRSALFALTVRFPMTIDSALGRYDGNAYKALWERAQQEPLNATEVAEAYEESIKPILLRGQSLAAERSKL